MSLALLSLLYLGFVIGTVACGMGLYFLVLKTRGVHKLGDVPGSTPMFSFTQTRSPSRSFWSAE